MLDWKRTPIPKTVEALNEKVDRLVMSMPDINFVPGVTLTNTPEGDRIAHGCRSAPRFVLIQLDNQNSGAMPEVGDIDSTYVRLYSFDNRVVNLAFIV